ncbi:MAG TPA: ion transporter [Kangiella sp.]
MQAKVHTLVHNKWFERIIISVIVLSGILIGIETSRSLSQNQIGWIELAHSIILWIFVIEVVLKLYACAPNVQKYFKDGWNVFDFTIVVVALIPFTGQFAVIGRLLRLLRVARLISVLPELRLIVTTLIKTIPSMFHVVVLMLVLFYIYAVAGFNLFHETNPQYWGDLGTSMLTLFRIVTLESWTQILYIDLAVNDWAWIFYVSFIVIGTFIIINLFIALVLNNLDEVKEQKKALERTQNTEAHILNNIVLIRKQLQEIEKEMHEKQ